MSASASAPVSVERIDAAGRAMVGECPVWRDDEQALYWVDIPARSIVRLQLDTQVRSVWSLPEQVGCFGFDVQGGVIAGLESGVFAVTLGAERAECGDVAHTAHSRWLAAPRFPAPNMRFNDGRCDRQGRFWAGTMVMDMSLAQPAGGLFRYDAARGLSASLVDGLVTQNGLAWSPDGTTMYLSDSHPTRRLIWAFEFDTDAGVPHGRRLFADLHHHAGRPDGAAVDADGCYWTCANDAGLLLRFTPAGRLDRRIALPARKPSMCAFGGRDLDTLFVTSIRPADHAGDDDGALFAVRAGVRGLPEPRFATPLS